MERIANTEIRIRLERAHIIESNTPAELLSKHYSDNKLLFFIKFKKAKPKDFLGFEVPKIIHFGGGGED